MQTPCLCTDLSLRRPSGTFFKSFNGKCCNSGIVFMTDITFSARSLRTSCSGDNGFLVLRGRVVKFGTNFSILFSNNSTIHRDVDNDCQSKLFFLSLDHHRPYPPRLTTIERLLFFFPNFSLAFYFPETYLRGFYPLVIGFLGLVKILVRRKKIFFETIQQIAIIRM